MLGRRRHPPNAALTYIYQAPIGWLPTWQANAQMTLNLKSSSFSVPARHPLGMLGSRRHSPDAVLTYIYQAPIGWLPSGKLRACPVQCSLSIAQDMLGTCSECARNMLGQLGIYSKRIWSERLPQPTFTSKLHVCVKHCCIQKQQEDGSWKLKLGFLGS